MMMMMMMTTMSSLSLKIENYPRSKVIQKPLSPSDILYFCLPFRGTTEAAVRASRAEEKAGT